MSRKEEFSFQDISNIFKYYKWSILTMAIIAGSLTYVYLYFQPSIYNSYAIVKVKPYMKVKSEDLINDITSTVQTKEVIEEISLLQTFKINSEALKKVNFKVQYFTDKKYSEVEIYKKVPIELKEINIENPDIIGRLLSVIPVDNGYKLQIKYSFVERIKHKVLGTKLFDFDDTKVYAFNQIANNDYFSFIMDKKLEINAPLHFMINGSKRNIFENRIRPGLEVTQLEKDTSLIKINYFDNIPDRAELYVNALTDSFIEHSINSKNKENNEALKYIVEELEKIKKELKESEEELERYQLSKSVVNPSSQAAIYIRELSDLEIEISENTLRKRLVSNSITFVENNYNLDAIAPSLTQLNDTNTLRLVERLQDDQLTETELLVEYTDEHPKLQSLRKQITSTRKKIAFNLEGLQKSINEQNNNLTQRKIKYERNLEKLPSQERELINIKRNYEVNSKMYDYLLEKKSENKILELATSSDYRIIDHAYISDAPVKPRRTLILLLSVIVGFVLGYILAVIRHNKDRIILGKDDIENLTALEIYGSIPYHKHKENNVQVKSEVKSPFAEAFRVLRTNLQFINKTNDSTVILITSTIGGEGKTTTSANLATILEMAKYKTVIINLDLRKPTLHKFFDFDNKIGISNYLNYTASLEDIVQATEFAHLDIVTSGPIPSDPSELILSKRLPELIAELKTKYDYVIIDTAPIGIVSDTKTIMQYSDMNFIIVRENFAKKNFLVTLEEMILSHGFKNTSVILNASKDKGGEYGYGYSYEYKE
ncbi:MAG: Tyrosine-protein kinase Wzc (EC [uncultured Sulfurovum sp.]|uniref:non-specific protein-tyrosine kinase n=1 Tax=uncultured Sulfurovum sp. TaxID=269237 RepID=A0A6S6SYQ6_9BACT|nr:MAG: Tyrosine-protein kinase Wzc (EC [uncultured Sulfurovum sp.]